MLLAKYGREKDQSETEDAKKQIQYIASPEHIHSSPEKQTLEAQDIAVQTPIWKAQGQRY